MKPVVFFSYSHKDEEIRNELEVHLQGLRKRDVISLWHDRRIGAGKDLDGSISEHLESSHIILLLVSPHFIASDYCYDIEMNRALERNKLGTAVVIPIIVEECLWQKHPFGKLRATPTDGKPISMWPNIHQALKIVAQDIEDAATRVAPECKAQDETLITPHVHGSKNEVIKEELRSSNLAIKKSFTAKQKDDFVDKAFETVLSYFRGSIDELHKREPSIDGQVRSLTSESFSAVLYASGEVASQCRIWVEGGGGRRSIKYSDGAGFGNSWNNELVVEDDGMSLFLTNMFSMYGDERQLSVIGGAELFWSNFIQRLQ
jgi:hypothetical protein